MILFIDNDSLSFNFKWLIKSLSKGIFIIWKDGQHYQRFEWRQDSSQQPSLDTQDLQENQDKIIERIIVWISVFMWTI